MSRITVVLLGLARAIQAQSTFTVASEAPASAGTPLPAYISYSFEFCFFPDYAGMSRLEVGRYRWIIYSHV